jgi:predicted NBD/HSP70 family sugar kinase
LRLGIDLGGTKVALTALDAAGRERLARRAPAPHAEYEDAAEILVQLILEMERDAGEPCSVGVGMPGAVAPASGLVFNAYNTPYNNRPLKADLEQRLGREVRFANDANCFALSESIDGAARGARGVFGAILGTGVGGGIVIRGRVLHGLHGISGEWGHTPLPWMSADEHPGPLCNCGRHGCIEQFLCGPALARDKAALGEAAAIALYADRLARALSLVVNFLDPEVIVLGGGVSNLKQLYAEVPRMLPRYAYCAQVNTRIVAAQHGDASGVRGAAMLWPG